MAQQLQNFTRKMMEGVIETHSTRIQHDNHCCQLAREYSARLGLGLGPGALPAPRTAPEVTKKTAAPSSEPVLPLSPAQARYIRSLRRKVSLNLLSPQHRSWVNTVCDGDEIAFKDARGLLEAMVSLADQTPGVRRRPEPAYIPEVGPYQVDDTVYLVVTAKDGDHRYAKEFNPASRKFMYAGQHPFDLLTVDRMMTAEQAKAFGDIYTVCCNCGRRLTKPHSKDLGYGPTCAEHRGWPY